MSPFPRLIGCRVAGTITNQQPQKVRRGPAESPVATGRGENVRVWGGARCSGVVNARGPGLGDPGGQVLSSKTLAIRAVQFSGSSGHEMGKYGASWGFTPDSLHTTFCGELLCGCSHLAERDFSKVSLLRVGGAFTRGGKERDMPRRL